MRDLSATVRDQQMSRMWAIQIPRPHSKRPLWTRTLILGALVLSLFVLAIPQRALAATSVTDNFNRANGTLGASWTDMSDGGLAISSQVVAGTKTGTSGDIRTAETYTSDQSSQIEVTATQISGGQWIGPAVRAQNGGQNLYLGIYFWNSGQPELMLFKRINGSFTQLGSTYLSGALAAGTQLNLSVSGSTLSFSQNGVVRITATDSTLTGGAPAVMAYGTATGDNWVGTSGASTGSGSYSVGGTVSGLTGTVVLANNGTNALTLSANGTFAFSSSLAQGAPYAVTVTSNPSGQTCTVANGSGTVGSANVTNVTVSCTTQAVGSVTDNFNRANGTLGASWTDMSDGGLAISSQVVAGTKTGTSGDIRTAETYTSDQSSQIEVTATQISGGQWIGPAVRAQNGGQNLYLGIYFWNSGQPELMLFKRINGSFTQLGSTYLSGALAAGTQLNLSVSGSTLSFSQNGVVRITATDSTLTGGAPAVMAYGTATGDNWVGTSGASTGSGSYSVGGTVSGLTGTVVLANNGTNALTLSANGTFAFSSSLAQGAPYAVTVTSNPSGQTCTVANGSGTVGSANVTNVTVSCTTQAVGSVTDNFNRANGTLGASWTDMSDGGLAISSQVVAGTKTGTSGDIRTAETYTSDQSSQIEVTATQISGGQWIGPAVRAQNGGQNLYLGIYFWNSGQPELMLFKRINGSFTQLGSTYLSGALAAGTQLNLSVSGSTLSFSQNGVVRITATDSTLTGGAPAVMAYGTATGDNWVGTSGASTGSGSYSVGGTVSGLTGTVVLANNGTNALTLSANGTFAFSSSLAQGAPYAVTVTSNPSGQTCTVANGSGTVGSANVTNVTVSCTTQAVGSVTDNFNRANGTLGASWTDMSDGGLAISSQVVAGTKTGTSGDIRTAETYTSDQSSQIEVTATQISGGQWIGPAVRAQNGGQNLYLGIYFWNSGQPELMLFKRINGSFTQLGSTYLSGALAAGTQLNLSVSGSTLSFSQNGVVRITATDSTLTGGAPAVMAYGTATGDNWVGTSGASTGSGSYSVGGTVSGLTGTVVLANNGTNALTLSANGTFAFSSSLAQGAPYAVTVTSNPSGQTCTVANGSGTVGSANVTNVFILCSAALSVQYQSTDANNIEYYTFTSPNDGNQPETLRVLRPTHPAAGVAHNFLYVLPVEAGVGSSFGDGIDTMAALDAEDQYNLTIIEPSFSIDPWYSNNSSDPTLQYETFMTSELQPWVRADLATTGTEQNWLIGFSKSGIGAQDLILKHPDLFQLAASWDFPADMSSYDEYSDSAPNYGTDANFQANYPLTAAFLSAHKTPFLTNNRIWIGGYNTFQTDIADYDALLTSQGIVHTNAPSQLVAHRWDGGWVPGALAGLYQDSKNLH